jgi:flagellar basal body-associated protein FliL
MIREIIGAKTVASMFMPNKRRKRKIMVPSMSTMGVLAGVGIAYMAMRKNKANHEEDIDE